MNDYDFLNTLDPGTFDDGGTGDYLSDGGGFGNWQDDADIWDLIDGAQEGETTDYEELYNQLPDEMGLEDYFNWSGTNANDYDYDTSGGGSILDQILGAVGGLGKNALSNLTSQGGLQSLIGAGLGMYSDRQNAKHQTQNIQQLMQAQDPWVNEYKKFIPQMQEAYANREQNPMYQMRNQAATRLMELAQNPQAAAPKWRG